MANPLQILVVDDDAATRQWLSSVLNAEGYLCHKAQNTEEAKAILRGAPIQLALVDIYLGETNGLEFVKQIKAVQPDCDCVVMTAHASIETVARSVSEGAIEYLGKPLLIDDLLGLVRRLERRHRASSPATEASEPEGFPGTAIVGRSPKMLEVYRVIARVAPTDTTVLIVGASGTGKELVARAIHTHSRRAQKPFTPINCGSFAETMLESELFGHEKGAFTGANTSRRGLFEATDGGTLFLDEISETSLSFQVKLLRAVQEKQIRRLGSNTYLPVDVRILAATNADLDARIRAKQFREDLYYRLSVVRIHVPALEERREDVPLLASHFLARFNERNDRQVTFAKDAMDALTRMSWPGNVRELENLIERAAIFTRTGEIAAEDVERERKLAASSATPADGSDGTLRDMERQQIQRALREAKGNRSMAAKILGIERKTLYNKARRLGIDLDSTES